MSTLIQWYPGHMFKAGKEIKSSLGDIDLIIEVLDARIPFSSQNPMLTKLRGAKPCIKLLNKSDLANPENIQSWQTEFEQNSATKTLSVHKEQSEKIKQIFNLCHKLVPEKGSKDKPIKALIMGIPNVGKSTLINILANRIIAKTGNEPAVTRQLQRIKLEQNIILFDTPGLMWPNVENRNSGYRLAITGAIKDTAIDHVDVAFFLAEYLLEHFPENLKTRFKLKTLPDNETELMLLIGEQRGCIRKGQQVDFDKTSKILLTEFRTDCLGKISLEWPDDIKQELAELEKIKTDKAAKKAARKKRKKS